MPVQPCVTNSKWGNNGHCYTGRDAKEKAAIIKTRGGK
jgi:hypothetical protein